MKKYSYLIILFIFWSCEENSLSPTFSDIPVVEAYLQPGRILQVQIDRQLAFSSEAAYQDDEISELEVFLSVDGVQNQLTYAADGLFLDSTVLVQTGMELEFEFAFGDGIVKGATVIPSKPVDLSISASTLAIEQFDISDLASGLPEIPNPIDISWQNPHGSFYLVVVENIENNPEPTKDFGEEDPPEFVFRNEPVRGNTFQIPPRSFNYYGTHRIILFHINDDYASLYDDGESTSQNLTTPSTGIENGVGIFTGIHSDTLNLEVTN